MTVQHPMHTRCVCALCAAAIALVSVADRIEFCPRALFCAPPPQDNPHSELSRHEPTVLPEPSSIVGSTGQHASARLAGESGLFVDAIVVPSPGPI